MKGYVITVDFKLAPGQAGKFRDMVEENARASCRDEPGCRRFDVMAMRGAADRIFLYEIYDNRAAFEAHLASIHFKKFNLESASLVMEKKVQEFDLTCVGSDE